MLVTVAVFALLLAPPMSAERAAELCVGRRQTGPFRYVMSCDSPSFMRLARNPGGLFSGPDTVWQSRPGYPILGLIAAAPFRIGNALAIRIAVWRSGGKYSFQSRLDPYFAGFLLLNWIALTTSVVLFLRLTQNKSPFSAAALFPIAVLMANGVTKGFFWTPHLQVLNVLIPLIALQVGISVRRSESSPTGLFLSIGILCGIASLLYGAFVLIIATATLALVIRPAIFSLRKKAVALSAGWLAFALPLLAWRTYVVQRTGHFYMHETAVYHEFVWIFETAAFGFPQFLSASQQNAAKFGRTVLVVLTLPVAILIALAFYWRSRPLPVLERLRQELLPAAAAFFIVAVPFFSLMGFYAARLTWQFVPPLLVLISAALAAVFGTIGPRAKTIASVMLVLASVVYVHHVVVSDQTVYLATGR